MRRRDRARLRQDDRQDADGRAGAGRTQRGRCFWYPMAIATLNEDPALASAALLAEVLKRAFFSRRSDSAFVYAKVGLSDLYCPGSVRMIEASGGLVETRAVVEVLEFGAEGKITGVRLRDGRRLQAANFIAAVPPAQLAAPSARRGGRGSVFRAPGRDYFVADYLRPRVVRPRSHRRAFRRLHRHDHAMAIQQAPDIRRQRRRAPMAI